MRAVRSAGCTKIGSPSLPLQVCLAERRYVLKINEIRPFPPIFVASLQVAENKRRCNEIEGDPLLVQLEGPKGNKPLDFSQIETVSTLFVKACPVVPDILSTALFSLG
jgi:hypothetical protein